MKNVLMYLFAITVLFSVISCEKEPIGETLITQEVENFKKDGDLISNQETMLKALSIWIATDNAKQWMINKRGIVKNIQTLDEVLVLEIVCSSEGNNLVDAYNSVLGTTYTTSQFSDYISSENVMLTMKYDSYFEPYLSNISEYTPLVSDKDRQTNYKDGELYDAASKLESEGGALIIGFRLTQAEDKVLYDPSSKTFNKDLAYQFCNEDLFSERLNELSAPLCNGKVPMSISKDIQRVFYEVCKGTMFFGPLGGPEICDNGIDDDNDGLIDCADPDCCAFTGCGGCPEEICGNGIDDDGDGLIDNADPDCMNNSPCMRDHYIEDNFFHEFQIQSPNSLTGMGGNLCGGVLDLHPAPGNFGASTSYGAQLFPSVFDNLSGIEEWYDFLIKIHWGTPTGSDGVFQNIIYRFHIWELANEPEFHVTYHSGGQQGTGGAGGIAILHVDVMGLTETYPVSLEDVPFYATADVCGINNWNPAIFGNIVAISIHETDNCTVVGTDGTVSTNTSTNTYTSGFTINLGLGDSINGTLTGGIMYTDQNVLATTETNTISSSYVTTYSNDYHCGQINYSYCWTDQGTIDQVHEIAFGNLIHLRMLSQICE